MEQTLRDALRDAMAEEMRRDESIFLMGEDVAQYEGAYKVTRNLLNEFGPKRVLDTPISEYGMTGLAVGAAFMGLRPIVEFMTFNFGMQALDHIINSAAKTLYMSGGQINCPIVFRGPNGAAARVAAQHSQCFASWFAHCPGLKVIAPRDAKSSKALLKSAIRDNNPVVFLENEMLYGQKGPVADDVDFLMPIGKAQILEYGDDITIVGFSRMLDLIEASAKEMKKEGINCEIIDLLSIRPLDFDTIEKSIKKTNKLLVVEESWPFAGIASEIITQAIEKCFDWLDCEPMRVAGADVPMPYASNLEALAMPSVKDINSAIRKMCNK
jgi:pyruvate dehydrogenase E1 component beta subunit